MSWLRPRTSRPPEPERPLPGLAPDPADARPVPGGNAWPDDAVLLTYGELRRLIALHLTYVGATLPRDRPWVWVAERARAVEDGEAPLLISEVLSP